MTRPRKDLVSVDLTPYYHVMSRCVRRGFLCGIDPISRKSYEHRKSWVEDRIRILSSLFAIDIAAYAVMSNHYHLVVKLDPQATQNWSMAEIFDRWTHLFSGPKVVQRYKRGEVLNPLELDAIAVYAESFRVRLGSLSWFMKCLNETIAREANKEDSCTGHFWEYRFKSQALRTEEALLTCMAYVDLNPVRANLAKTPEESMHTSLRERVTSSFDCTKAVARQVDEQVLNHFTVPLKPLLPLSTDINTEQFICFTLNDYLQLVDSTGRIIVEGKRGSISGCASPVLVRLKLSAKNWQKHATNFEQCYQHCFGSRVALRDTG